MDTDDESNSVTGHQLSKGDDDNIGWQEVKFEEYPLEHSEDEDAEFMGMMRSSMDDEDYDRSLERELESEVKHNGADVDEYITHYLTS